MARRPVSEDRSVEPIPSSAGQIVGRRYLRAIETALRGLRAHRDHARRKLYYDHVVVAHLLAFFNPGLRGLRSVEDLFDIPRVRRIHRSPRIPRSTLADAQRLFDPHLLLPLIRDLRNRVQLQDRHAGLDRITRKLLAVDGSFFVVAPRIAWALYNQSQRHNGKGLDIRKGQVRLNLHFDVLTGLPEHATLTDGQTREDESLRNHLRPDAFYVLDRGFQAYTLLADIVSIGSDFVVRLRKTARWEERDILPLTAEDQAAGVMSDTRVTLGWRRDRRPPLPVLRRVEVRTLGRDGAPGVAALLTNRLDLPAWMIALIYQHRWQVELFFRWLKCVAHFKHFFSESPQGMTLQVYVAIIATLLIALETGARPSKYDFSMATFIINGTITPEEALPVMTQRRAERARAAQWQREYNARKAAEKKAH